MIRITQDISTEPVTTAKVRQFIKHSDDSDTDEISLIEDMIKGVRVHIENRTGLCLAEKTLVEYFFKEETGEYVLSFAPVISVDDVKLLDIEETSSDLTLNDDYYLRGLYERILLTDEVGAAEQLKVTYKAGYGDSSTETLPMDIHQAILRQVIHWYDNRDEFIEGVYINDVTKIIQYYKRSFV